MKAQSGRITLEGMRFHAYHGVYPEEQTQGNTFLVDVSFNVSIEKPGISDNLDDTIDYSAVYKIIAEQMAVPSQLLEHLMRRMQLAITGHFPQMADLEICIRKINPPMGGEIYAVSLRTNNSL
ncbi:MAG: dihydroneopterin aldolase [Bacteroidia bacterium]|jgi:dihydroneopterin aldolase|nr:dihydroneopterin aldolase [Bacteroidia bacterium]MCC6769133.1 dihydroneopterin aldolase [Bacteroidia bacterium]